ncbi:MAG TPA: LON peptidase substrate-binding domain-containing protein [Polyangiaceae bacterium]|nr:LON peptidase substrate-binding domain-containing protein [Polyangiaceae bacterium]
MVPEAPRKLPDLAPALEALPLFPLETVLFPGALLPLHVFEPRYRALVRDILETHRALSVVLVTNPLDIDAHGHPAIASVAGAGVIIDYAELPDGRFNILVRGRARVRLRELPFEPPYRRAAATVIESPEAEVTQSDLASLVSAATSFTSLVRERERSFELPLPKNAPPALIADLCAHHLVIDPRERQAILEMADVPARVRHVAEVLAMQRLALSGEPREVN